MCSGEDCSSVRIVGGPSLLPLYRPAIDALLQGPPEEVTPRVRRAVYGALRVILLHRNVEQPDSHTLDILFQGLMDNDRSTRVQAGCVETAYSLWKPRTHASGLAMQ
jgi:serine/threonine-protein kinase ATR